MFKGILLVLVCSLTLSLAVFANSVDGLFSNENFQVLKDQPSALFSKINTCRLTALLGKKNFSEFRDTMALVSSTEDAPGYVSISGNVQGLFTIMEGFFRMSRSGQIWVAYLKDGKVYYFTNDGTSINQSPKILLDWASRFKDAKWVNRRIFVGTDYCNDN